MYAERERLAKRHKQLVTHLGVLSCVNVTLESGHDRATQHISKHILASNLTLIKVRSVPGADPCGMENAYIQPNVNQNAK
jgi:hypothetical protein